MTTQPDSPNSETVRVDAENLPEAIQRGTGPLDFLMPWIIKFRVIGTTNFVQIEATEHMTVGRSDVHSDTYPDIDLEPFNARALGVSRIHMEIIARNSRVTVRDMDSSNGSFLNDGRMLAGTEYRLQHGDRLMLGKLALQVQFVVIPSSHEKQKTDYRDISIPAIGSGQAVLLVDDDTKANKMISDVLGQAGFSVLRTLSANEALTTFEKESPEIILMEWLLPDMNGSDVVRYIRDKDPNRKTSIVVMSGGTGGYQTNQAVSAGADVFLTKPIGVDEIMASLKQLV